MSQPLTDPAREALLVEVDRQVAAQQAECAARLRAVLGPSPADLERARLEALAVARGPTT